MTEPTDSQPPTQYAPGYYPTGNPAYQALHEADVPSPYACQHPGPPPGSAPDRLPRGLILALTLGGVAVGVALVAALLQFVGSSFPNVTVEATTSQAEDVTPAAEPVEETHEPPAVAAVEFDVQERMFLDLLDEHGNGEFTGLDEADRLLAVNIGNRVCGWFDDGDELNDVMLRTLLDDDARELGLSTEARGQAVGAAVSTICYHHNGKVSER